MYLLRSERIHASGVTELAARWRLTARGKLNPAGLQSTLEAQLTGSERS
jgi:hypothetical protein